MPPRYAYWTILIDDKPTAFRAREREELQPTFVQLQRKNPNVTVQWFARGRLWASREAERDDFQMHKHAAMAPRRDERPEGAERRGSDWRPGGAHKDPRDRFKKKNRPERAWSEKDPATQRDRDKPGYAASRPRDEWRDKPAGDGRRPGPSGPGGKRPWTPRPPGKPDVAQGFSPAKRERKPWSDKPAGPPRGDRPWSSKPPSAGGWRDRPGGGDAKRPWSGKPRDKSDVAQGFSPAKRERKPWTNKPAGSAPPSDRPWQTKPTGPRAQRKPWVGKPDVAQGSSPAKPRGDRRPARHSSSDPRTSGGGWSNKPPAGAPRGDRPWSNKPAGGAPRGDRPWRDKPPGSDRRPWSGKPPGKSGVPPGPGKPGAAQGFSPARPSERKPWSNKPAAGAPRGDRPREPRRSSSDSQTSGGGWSNKPPSAAGGKRPWSSKPPASGGGQRPWSGKPREQDRKPFAPRGPRSDGAPADGAPRKRRDDDPDRD